MQAINPFNGTLPTTQDSKYQQDYIYIVLKQETLGRPRRWYYLNRFTLSTTSSPTLVGFFVCGMMGRL
jgi:hypothetical protein